jgi:putative glutamine amidotransferase
MAEQRSGAPRVGVCTAVEAASWGHWRDQRAAVVAFNYVEAIQRGGGMALLLPPDPASEADPASVLELLDALVLIGGRDVESVRYGATPHPLAESPGRERDRFELSLVRQAVVRDLPLLGICRGMQILNVAFGGTLCQQLTDLPGVADHMPTPGALVEAAHDVTLSSGSLAARTSGSVRLATQSHHHQGVDALGEGLVASGHSSDRVVEAIEMPSRRFVLGVQWHPEADPNSRLFASLIESARSTRGSRIAVGQAIQ